MKGARGKSSVACFRCKARKKRCDGDVEQSHGCSGCKTAGVECVFPAPLKPAYVKKLEDRIKYLEAQIEMKEERSSPASEVSHASVGSAGSSGSRLSSLIECAASIPLQNDLQTSVYVGSSGLSIAHMVQSYVMDDRKVEVDEGEKVVEAGDTRDEVERIINDDGLVSFYVENYCSGIHVRYPFLQKSKIMELHNNRHKVLGTCAGTREGLLSGSNETCKTLDRFVLLMVYAIGAYLKHEGKASAPPNHLHLYRYAIGENFEMIFQNETLGNIHAILLLVIYKLRKPNGSTIWYLIGNALRVCVDFGLHRRNLQEFRDDPHTYLLKCNTFWSVYALERIISQTFGRPFSISDRDIDVDLPLDIDESVTDPNEIKNKFYLTYPQHNKEGFIVAAKSESPDRTSNSMAIVFLRLRKIDSLIQSKLYRVDKDTEYVPRETIAHVSQRMKQWLNSLPPFLTTFEYYYCLFLFNKQIRSLLVPYINRLSAKDPLFIECIKSCLNVCKLNRKLFDNGHVRNRLSIVSLQTIFLSGITIIYGIFSHKVNWNFEVGEALRNCSSTLLLLSERAPTCRKFSETFERLLEEVNQRRSTVHIEEPAQQSVDLFDQEMLMKRVNERHYMENMNTFNTMTESFETMFSFSSVDGLNLGLAEFDIDLEI